MTDFVDKAKDFADSHEQQVDQGLERAGGEADKRTGGRYDKQIDKGVQTAEEHVGDDHQK